MRTRSARIHTLLLLSLGALLIASAETCGELSPSGSEDGIWLRVGRGIGDGETIAPLTFVVFAADEAALEALLASAPSEFSGGDAAMLHLPMPDGSYARVAVEASPILSEELQAQHPELRAYRAQGVDDPSATGRFDFTPRGFHAMLISERGTVFVDRGADGRYLSYWKSDLPGEPFECGHDHAGHVSLAQMVAAFPANSPSGSQLRTYRLAMSATGEYTDYWESRDCPPGSPAGCDVTAAMNRITTTVNRVTGIYEREVAISFVLSIANIYTDPGSDPFTGVDADCPMPDNGCAVSLMRGENQTVLDADFGDGAYDVGHIFSQGGSGGIASGGVVCSSGNKARGATSRLNPSGDAFDVDFVAHEIGHQFNADHTWTGNSGSCSAGQFVASSAYEPGSGSTIMAYAGICAGQNVQPNSDSFFHTRSFDQIVAFRDGSGACGTLTATGNAPPTVEAGPDCTIPRDTPFTLTAMGDDGDGDPLTFSWEQFDQGARVGLPSSTRTTGPLFRSLPATTSPSRTFPRFANILSGVADIAPGMPGFAWEVLPAVDRSMDFRVTVRDNQADGGGVDWDSMTVNVSGAPFAVTTPASGGSLECGASETIGWSVGGGSVATDVAIAYSQDGGSTFASLVPSTPNDGSHTVDVPAALTGAARIQLVPSSECFFAISDSFSVVDTTDPTITAPPDLPAAECTSPAGASPALGAPTVSDACDGSPGVGNDAPPVFPLGTTTVTWTATDASSNSADDTQNITVVDTTPPTITAPTDVVAECTSPEGTPVDIGMAVASDVCDPAPAVMNDAPALFPLGDTTVTWEVTDAAGLMDDDLQTVTIGDTTPPELEISAVPPASWPPAHRLVTVEILVTVSDLCDAAPVVRLVSITSDEPDDGIGDGSTTDDIQGADFGTDDRTVQLRSERSGVGPGRVYTLTYEAEDASGNTTTRQTTVQVSHDQGS